jgi:cytochrome c
MSFVQRERSAMDSFELNKVLGAVLGTCLILLSLNIAAGALFSAHPPAKPGYEIAVPEQAATGAQPGAAEADPPLPVRLAKADLGRGEASAKKCAACHTFGKGEPNRVGPNLWGIVGRDKASEAGFNYSRHCTRHQHDLRRHHARGRTRRSARIPEQQGRQSGPIAQGG